jgi:hypothetical protein
MFMCFFFGHVFLNGLYSPVNFKRDLQTGWSQGVLESVSSRFVLQNIFVASYNTQTETCSLVYAVRKNPADPKH